MKTKVTCCRFTLVLLLLITSTLFAAPRFRFKPQRATLHERLAASRQVTFSVFLPLQHRDLLKQELAALNNSNSPEYHHWLTPQQFEKKYGPTAQQVRKVQAQLAAYNLQSRLIAPRYFQVTGTARQVERAFNTELRRGTFPNGRTTIAADRPLLRTGAIAQLGAVVTGLSGVIRMQRHSIRSAQTMNRYSSTGGYYFDDLKQAYDFPAYSVYHGAGRTIGVIMEGDFQASDMNQYFSHENLPTPNFTTVNVNGGHPYDPDTSLETELDLQQAGGMAPGANIILYNLSDLSDGSLIAGLLKIVIDNKADVVSMSFGSPEAFYTPDYNGGLDETLLMRIEDGLFAQGNAQGISFVASSGDFGALSMFPATCLTNTTSPCGSYYASAEFPASSPHVTGVGGTNLVTTYSGSSSDLSSAYVSEEAFYDPLTSDINYGTQATGLVWGSGGGDSIVFARPDFQAILNTGNTQFRTVPDVAMHMGGCPEGSVTPCNPNDSSDIAVVGGQTVQMVGTSAAAPDFAGLAALLDERFGERWGNLNYYVYALAAGQAQGLNIQAYRHGVPGNNGLYATTSSGYNRVLGNGSIDASRFLLLPPDTPAAGTPQTPSNP